MYATFNTFVYPEHLNQMLYCRYIGELCSHYDLTFRDEFAFVTDIKENSAVNRTKITTVLHRAYKAIASVYKQHPERGALLLADLVKPVSTDLTVMFSRIAIRLQAEVNVLRYAKYSMPQEETRYAMIAIMLVLSKYEEFRGPVADACAEMLDKPELQAETHLEQQRYIAREFFGQGWEFLYADEEMNAVDVVREVLVAKPPFRQRQNPRDSAVLVPNDITP